MISLSPDQERKQNNNSPDDIARAARPTPWGPADQEGSDTWHLLRAIKTQPHIRGFWEAVAATVSRESGVPRTDRACSAKTRYMWILDVAKCYWGSEIDPQSNISTLLNLIPPPGRRYKTYAQLAEEFTAKTGTRVTAAACSARLGRLGVRVYRHRCRRMADEILHTVHKRRHRRYDSRISFWKDVGHELAWVKGLKIPDMINNLAAKYYASGGDFRIRPMWTEHETEVLHKVRAQMPDAGWAEVAAAYSAHENAIPRTARACRQRYYRDPAMAEDRAARALPQWTRAETGRLFEIKDRMRGATWRQLADAFNGAHVGVNRSATACRLHYVNLPAYKRPAPPPVFFNADTLREFRPLTRDEIPQPEFRPRDFLCA